MNSGEQLGLNSIESTELAHLETIDDASASKQRPLLTEEDKRILMNIKDMAIDFDELRPRALEAQFVPNSDSKPYEMAIQENSLPDARRVETIPEEDEEVADSDTKSAHPVTKFEVFVDTMHSQCSLSFGQSIRRIPPPPPATITIPALPDPRYSLSSSLAPLPQSLLPPPLCSVPLPPPPLPA